MSIRLGYSLPVLGAFVNSVGQTAAANLVIAGATLVAGVLAARTMGPTARGELAIIQIWPPFIASLAMLGMPEALVFFSSKTPTYTRTLLGKCLLIAAIGSGGAIVVFGALMPFLLQHQSADVVVVSQLSVAGMAFAYLLGGLPHQALRGLGLWKAWNILRTVSALSWLIMLLWGEFALNVQDASTFGLLFVLSQILAAMPVGIASLISTLR